MVAVVVEVDGAALPVDEVEVADLHEGIVPRRRPSASRFREMTNRITKAPTTDLATLPVRVKMPFPRENANPAQLEGPALMNTDDIEKWQAAKIRDALYKPTNDMARRPIRST